MPNEKTDTRGFSTNNQDVERDVAAKGGPAVGLHGISHPYYADLQTQIAAKSKKKIDLPDVKEKAGSGKI